MSALQAYSARPGRMKSTAPRLEGDTRAVASEDHFLTVTALASELGVTARALRFYEDKGLITPRRIANTRVYSHRERARMILILRGKRLGFSLRDIKDYLDLYDADPKRVTQTRALLRKIETRSQQLEDQRLALDQALKGLRALKEDALAVLARAERKGPDPRATGKSARHGSAGASDGVETAESADL